MLSHWCGIAVLVLPLTAPALAQTRAEADSSNPLRRCAVAREAAEPGDMYAVRCAEYFVARQGYIEQPGLADTTVIVPEGIEWGASRGEWLSRRRSTLRARAAGVCIDPGDQRYTVVFLYANGAGARGVTLDRAFGSLRVQHQDFRFEVVEKKQYGCHALVPPKAQ